MPACYYCKYYRSADLYGKPDSKGIQWKKCKIKKKDVYANSKSCKYFDPAEYFHCDAYGQSIHIANCLQRRFNPKGFDGWKKCRKCRQFEKHVSLLVNTYMLTKTKIIKPRLARQLKRRIGKPRIIAKPQKRVLNRRKGKDKPRQLKRRKTKPVRKLKRRK